MIENNKIYAFAGRKRSGKGVLSNILKDKYDAEIVTVANYLKYLCCDILECDLEALNTKKDDGTVFSLCPDERWYSIINEKTGISISDIKNDISNIEFTNIRQMLQVIGTDCIRKHNEQWHVNCMKEDIKRYLSEGKLVAVDDVRFPNEKKAIEELGGICYFIVRPINNNVSNHVSETSLVWNMFDENHIIINDSSLEGFRNKFISHLENNMNDLDSDFLLSERTDIYTSMNVSFGLTKLPIIDDIISQNKDNKNFLEKGIISFKPSNTDTHRDFLSRVYNKSSDGDIGCHASYILYNPLINENLKVYL